MLRAPPLPPVDAGVGEVVGEERTEVDVGVEEVVIKERAEVEVIVMNMGEGSAVGIEKVKGKAEASELTELELKQSVVANRRWI